MQILAGLDTVGVNVKEMKTKATQPWRSLRTIFLACKRMTHEQRRLKTWRRPGDLLADIPTYTFSARLYKKNIPQCGWRGLTHITGIFGSDLLVNTSPTALGERD